MISKSKAKRIGVINNRLVLTDGPNHLNCNGLITQYKTTYKIDIPANRYDLLCIEGLVRAIKTFEGKPPVEYTLSQPNQFEKIIIEKDVASVRPIVMGAVLRNVTFTEGKGQIVLLHVKALYMKQKLTLVKLLMTHLSIYKTSFIRIWHVDGLWLQLVLTIWIL